MEIMDFNKVLSKALDIVDVGIKRNCISMPKF